MYGLLLKFVFVLTIYYLSKCNNIKCRKCNKVIGNTLKLMNKKSSMSINSNKKIIFSKSNVLVHTFKNPNNFFFELFTIEEANLLCDENNIEAYTFFPAYGWNSCICAYCGTHHGWKFNLIQKYCGEANSKSCESIKSFYGLSTENVISSEENDPHQERVEL